MVYLGSLFSDETNPSPLSKRILTIVVAPKIYKDLANKLGACFLLHWSTLRLLDLAPQTNCKIHRHRQSLCKVRVHCAAAATQPNQLLVVLLLDITKPCLLL